MELLLVFVIALLLLKPHDVLHLAQFFGRLLAWKRKSHKHLQQLLDEATKQSTIKKKPTHDHEA